MVSTVLELARVVRAYGGPWFWSWALLRAENRVVRWRRRDVALSTTSVDLVHYAAACGATKMLDKSGAYGVRRSGSLLCQGCVGIYWRFFRAVIFPYVWSASGLGSAFIFLSTLSAEMLG